MMNTVDIVSLCLTFIGPLITFTLRVSSFDTASSFTTDWSLKFDYNTYIDEDQLFKLYWTNLENDQIDIGIEVKATGWIALGISPRGQMPNSDIAIGWVDDEGKAYLQDRYTIARSTPLYDSNQNLTLTDGEEINGMTRLRFTRPKYSCDPDDLSLTAGTTRLIWAFHATEDPKEECFESGSISYHTNKGSQSINLDSGVPEEVQLEDDVQYLDFTMGNYSVPATDTTYLCKLFKVPRFNDTQHIVKFSTIVEEGNEAVVHHILVYDCPEYIATDPAHEVFEGICEDDEINMPSTSCRSEKVAYVWAVGGNDLYMPENAGMPISGDSDFHYLLVEMHYDNPLEKAGIIDDSGFRMYFTPTLRENDVGVLSIGLTTDVKGQWIPPGLKGARSTAFGTKECTEDAIPSTGINVFGSFLHQHTIGWQLNLRHIRDGKELKPIDTNLAYDFNYQQTIIYEDQIVLLPGDEFILDCYTDSSERTWTTTGGESSSQEMCFAFLFYYPAMPLTFIGNNKAYSAYSAWMKDAQTAGYLNGTSQLIDDIFSAGSGPDFVPDFSQLFFDASIDGGLEFYNRLNSVDYPDYNKNTLFCTGENPLTGDRMLFNSQVQEVARNESFEAYDSGVDDCENAITVGSSGVGQCIPSDATPAPTVTDIENPSASCIISTNWMFIFVLIVLMIIA